MYLYILGRIPRFPLILNRCMRIIVFGTHPVRLFLQAESSDYAGLRFWAYVAVRFICRIALHKAAFVRFGFCLKAGLKTGNDRYSARHPVYSSSVFSNKNRSFI